MASSGKHHPANAETMQSASSTCKVKRTPVILNLPRKPAGAHFKVLQWNVLADGLAQNGDFCRVPPGCLEWEYRKPLLLQEILEANADIICLQELNHFDELRQALAELGYEGAFREKHASPALKYEYPPDGMAVFFRSQRFSAAGAVAVEGRSFRDDATGREQSQGYLQILLTDRLVGRQLLVVTTHLKAKDGAECEELRYQQARQLLHNVADTVRRLRHQQHAGSGDGGGGSDGGDNGGNGNGNGGGVVAAAATAAAGGSSTGANGSGAHADGGRGSNGASSGVHGGAGSAVPVVVTGDFNTMPGSKTCEAFRRHPLGLLSLWEQRPLDPSLLSDCSGSDVEGPWPPAQPPVAAAAQRNGGGGAAAAAAGAPSLSMSLSLSEDPDAWGSWRPGREFSTWKFRVKGESKRISDYIWFSGGGALRPLARWRMLTEEEIGPTALPSSSYASDHVSLCCEFEWDVEEEAVAAGTAAAAAEADLGWAPSERDSDWG